MKNHRLTLTLLCLLVAVPLLAADPEPVAPVNAGQAGDGEPAGGSAPNLDINKAELQDNAGRIPLHPELASPEGLAANPLLARINQVLDSADVRLIELEARLQSETSNTAALDIIKQIEQVKVQAELDMLAVQASYARQTSREDLALEIEGAIAEMTTPRPARQPVDRPAPAAGSH